MGDTNSRIPRPDRVMPVAQQRKDLGLGGRIHAPSVGSQMWPYRNIVAHPRCPDAVDLNLHGLMLCLGFSPTDLLEAFPGFSTVCWLPLAICSSPLARPWRRCLFPLCRSFVQFAFSFSQTYFLTGSALTNFSTDDSILRRR